LSRAAVRAVLDGARIQRAVTVGPAEDAHEREAVAVADRVASGPAAPEHPAPERSAAEQRAAERAREPEEEARRVQRVPLAGLTSGFELDSGVAARIAAPGAGRPLPPQVAAAVAPWLPYDFSAVRVHDTPQAAADVAALHARAFTFGHNIWLGAGEAITDLRLMSHELAHVAQQGAAVAWRSGAWMAPTAGAPLTPTAGVRVQRSIIPGFILTRVHDAALQVPGYRLLCVFVGSDPITDERVERTPLNVARAVLEFVPRGQEFLDALQRSGGLQRAFEVIQQGWVRLNITEAYVGSLLGRMVDAADILHPFDSAQRMAAILEEPGRRVLEFARTTGAAVLEVIFDAAMSVLGPRAQRVADILKRARSAFTAIIRDPAAFVGHLMDALKQGFRQFGANILTHLGQGLITWLTGALSSAGIQLPAEWDFRGVLSIVLQVLGLTWNSIRTKLVRAIGERAVAIAETAMPFLVTLVRQGPAAAWQQLLEYIGNLRDTVINGIRDWVRNTIVVQALERVATLLVPGGAIIQAIEAIYNGITFVLDQLDRLIAMVDTVVNSLSRIVAGQIGEAANAVEQTLANFVPLVIDLLARLLHLSGLPARIRQIIDGIRARVDAALDRLVAWIVERARAIIARVQQTASNIAAWWRARLAFQVENESHAVYLDGDPQHPQVMVSSTPQTVEAYIAAGRSQTTQADRIRAYAAVETALANVRAHLPAAQEAEHAGAPEPPEFARAMEGLRDSVAALMRLSGRPPTPEPQYGALRDGLGTSMDVAPLTTVGVDGTEPSATNPIWELVRGRYQGGRTFYVRGHLLNHNLHGSGSEARNLAPISQDDNATHEREIESLVKQRVIDQHRTVHYSVTLGWGQTRNVSVLKAQLAQSDFDADRRREISNILDAEQKLPSSLTGRAIELNDAQAPVGSPFVNRTIPLRIPNDLEGFTGARPRQDIVLSSSPPPTVSALMTIPGLTESQARSILDARAHVTGPLTRYEQLGLPLSLTDRLRNDRHITL
jgi:hypothetical protein